MMDEFQIKENLLRRVVFELVEKITNKVVLLFISRIFLFVLITATVRCPL